MRLEAIDRQHVDTVALMSGPLVLFAITDSNPHVSRAQLLGARKTGPQNWQVESATTPLTLLPFTAIGEEQYRTYLRVS